MKNRIDWTSTMVAELRRLMALPGNLSFNVIAGRMAKKFDAPFTRNSTVGKAHRLKLPPRPPRETVNEENTKPRSDRRVLRTWSRPAQLPPRRIVSCVHEHGLDLLELERSYCKWPSGTRAPYTFCGEPTIDDNAPYCALHTGMAYATRDR
jgi:hypothetical protein